jgi:excisionase family DNA binding protein
MQARIAQLVWADGLSRARIRRDPCTAAEVADILHVLPKTVSRWAKEGKLPFLKTLGGHRRYPKPKSASWPRAFARSQPPNGPATWSRRQIRPAAFSDDPLTFGARATWARSWGRPGSRPRW